MPSIHHDQRAPVPLGFVRELPSQLGKGAVGDGLCKMPVTPHTGDVEVLQADHLILVDQPRGELVQRIAPAVTDTLRRL